MKNGRKPKGRKLSWKLLATTAGVAAMASAVAPTLAEASQFRSCDFPVVVRPVFRPICDFSYLTSFSFYRRSIMTIHVGMPPESYSWGRANAYPLPANLPPAQNVTNINIYGGSVTQNIGAASEPTPPEQATIAEPEEAVGEKPSEEPGKVIFRDGYGVICRLQYDDEARRYLDVLAEAVGFDNLQAYNLTPRTVGYRDKNQGHRTVFELRLPESPTMTEDAFLGYITGEVLQSGKIPAEALDRVERKRSDLKCDPNQ